MRVVVAMSGGVDSSVAALKLREAGHDVIGVFLRNGVAGTAESRRGQGCCSISDAHDAEEVAGLLGIPFYSLDHSAGFERIVRDFVNDYAEGRTPNPCVQCNRDLKLGELGRFAAAMGASHVATGHYARCSADGAGVRLCRAADRDKDQSYVLATVRRDALARSLFPLGEIAKAEVRAMAERAGLPVHAKSDSQEICFVPSGDYRDLLRQRRPELFLPGAIRDSSGNVLGAHPGAAGFTVGQRRGLGLGGRGPFYVLATDPRKNRVTVGRREELGRPEAVLEEVRWLAESPEGPGSRTATVQVRAHHEGREAVLEWQTARRLTVRFEGAGEVIAPGQIGVVYDGDRVLAAGRLV